MIKRVFTCITFAAAVAVVGLLALHAKRADSSAPALTIEKGAMSVVSVYEGEIQSRRTHLIMSRVSGPATIVELAAEGTQVKSGDVLVRFDGSKLERDLLKLEKDHALAGSEIEGMEKAELPLKVKALEAEISDARTACSLEQQYLRDTEELLEEGLVSQHEVDRQKTKVEKAERVLANKELELKLTREYLHPSLLAKARATLDSASQALQVGKQQLDQCTVHAPLDGSVVYRPLYVGTEYRVVRVGDAVHQNQPFMAIADMSALDVHCYIPEAELSGIQVGKEVVVTPLAYPDLRLTGKIRSVAATAQPLAWRPMWQKYFHVIASLDQPDPRLRTGMSVHAHVFSYDNDEAVLVPRAAVFWRANRPYCRVAATPKRGEERELQLGRGNASHYEVIAGLKPGDKVFLP
jgi:multidrug resistance efflux pump